jgi:hypothetical protein
MDMYWGVDVQIHVLFILALVGGEWVSGQLQALAALPLRKEPLVPLDRRYFTIWLFGTE